jgi:Flp pilus assembly protein TadD
MRNALPSVLTVLLIVLCTGCATPRIIVLSDPLDAREHNDLGVSHEASGELDLARRSYAEAADRDPSWDQPLINLGNTHAAQGEWDAAATAYKKAIRRNSGNPESMNNLAYALVQMGEHPEAVEWSRKALELAPDNPIFMGTGALALFEAGHPDLASGLVDRALRILPETDPLRPKLAALKLRILRADTGHGAESQP